MLSAELFTVSAKATLPSAFWGGTAMQRSTLHFIQPKVYWPSLWHDTQKDAKEKATKVEKIIWKLEKEKDNNIKDDKNTRDSTQKNDKLNKTDNLYQGRGKYKRDKHYSSSYCKKRRTWSNSEIAFLDMILMGMETTKVTRRHFRLVFNRSAEIDKSRYVLFPDL